MKKIYENLNFKIYFYKIINIEVHKSKNNIVVFRTFLLLGLNFKSK